MAAKMEQTARPERQAEAQVSDPSSMTLGLTAKDLPVIRARVDIACPQACREIERLFDIAERDHCPLAIGKIIAKLSEDLTPGPVQRIRSEHLPLIENLREIRQSLFRPESSSVRETRSRLSVVRDAMLAVATPANETRTAYVSDVCVFAVLWANAACRDELINKGVHYLELAGQLGWKPAAMSQWLSTRRRAGWILPPDGSGSVCLPARYADYFVERGLSFWPPL